MFDFLKSRRQRESANQGLSVGDLTGQVAPLSSGDGTDAQGAAWTGAQGGVDLAQIGQIGAMIAEAAKSGNIQIQQGDAQTAQFGGAQSIDLQGSGLREEIMEIMGRYGVSTDPSSAQQVDASQMPQMQQEIMEVISRQGVDLGAYLGGSGASSGDAPSTE
jgi:hypothetical protein